MQQQMQYCAGFAEQNTAILLLYKGPGALYKGVFAGALGPEGPLLLGPGALIIVSFTRPHGPAKPNEEWIL